MLPTGCVYILNAAICGDMRRWRKRKGGCYKSREKNCRARPILEKAEKKPSKSKSTESKSG